MRLNIKFRVRKEMQDKAKWLNDIINFANYTSNLSDGMNVDIRSPEDEDDGHNFFQDRFFDKVEDFRKNIFNLFDDQMEPLASPEPFGVYEIYKDLLKPNIWAKMQDGGAKDLMLRVCDAVSKREVYPALELGYDFNTLKTKLWVDDAEPYRNGLFCISIDLENFEIGNVRGDEFCAHRISSEYVLESRTGRPECIDVGYGMQVDGLCDNAITNWSISLDDTDIFGPHREFKDAARLISMFGIKPDEHVEGNELIESINIVSYEDDILKRIKDFRCYTTDQKDGFHLQFDVEGFKSIFDFSVNMFIAKSDQVVKVDESIKIREDQLDSIANKLKVARAYLKDTSDFSGGDEAKDKIDKNNKLVYNILLKVLLNMRATSTGWELEPYELTRMLSISMERSYLDTEAEKHALIDMHRVKGVRREDDFIYNILDGYISTEEYDTILRRLFFISKAVADGMKSITLEDGNLRVVSTVRGVVADNIKYFFNALRDEIGA